MCRCAYGVPANMIIVPASRMTVDGPLASAPNGQINIQCGPVGIGRGMPQPNIPVVHGVCGGIDTQILGRGSYVLHSIANVFTLDLTTGLRYDILTPRGSVDRQLATCTVHWRIRASPCAAEIGGGVCRATAHSDRRSKGRRLDEASISKRAHRGLDNDNRRDMRGAFKPDSQCRQRR